MISGVDVPSLSLSTDQYNQIKSAVEKSDRTNSSISSIKVIDKDNNGELSKGDRVTAYMNSTIGLTGSGLVDDSFLEGNGFKKFQFGS